MATGIVKRTDEIGRMLIPKEIRYALNIKEGDPIEIFIGSRDEIILKKYSFVGELAPLAKGYADSLSLVCEDTVCIVDKERVIAVSGGMEKELADKYISLELETAINRCHTIIASRYGVNFVPVLDEDDEEVYRYELIVPIISGEAGLGAVVLLSKTKKTAEAQIKSVQAAADFLGKRAPVAST